MIKMRFGAAGMLAGVLFVSSAQAQVAEDAATTLKDSAKAIQELKGVTYKSHLYGKGPLEKLIDGNGTVKVVRQGGDPKHNPVWVEGDMLEPGKGKVQFVVSTDGSTIWWEDAPSNKLFKRPFMDRTDAWSNLNRAQQVVIMEMADAAPYSRELKAEKLEVTGTEKVRGEACKIVTASWANPDRTSTWYISVADNLPRKLEQSVGGAGGLIKGTEIWEVKPQPSLKASDLAQTLKKGWVLDEQAAPAQPPQPKLEPIQNPTTPPPPAELGLKAGSMAPDFDLKSADGKSVKLSSLKGNVVLLSFFGTMFAKSDDMNKVAQEVQDSMAGKVKVVGLACRSDSDKAVADYAKDKKYTFTVVPKADTIVDQFRVVGFPSLYVINAEGNVAAFFQGAATKEQVMKAIEDAGKPGGDKAVGAKPGDTKSSAAK
jgi:peroxiredoxin